MKKILVLILILSFSNHIYAQGTIPYGVAAPGTSLYLPGTAPTWWGGANLSSLSYGATAAGNATQSTWADKLCGGMNPFMCVVAGLSAVQAVIAIAGYFDSKDSKNSSACQGAFCNNQNNPNQPGPNTPPAGPPNPYTYEPPDLNDPMTPVLRSAQNTLRSLRAKGYEVSPDGSVTGPDGKTTTPAQAAAAASSLSPEEQAKLAEIQQAGAQEAKKFVDMFGGDGSSETGGGKRRNAGGDGAGSGFNMNAFLKSLNRDGKRGVAGLSVRAGTDNVGVKESNIFDQASSAYNKDQVLNRGNP